jgi:Concanavalin A-like lectin/glucanases superfamily/GLEYA domain
MGYYNRNGGYIGYDVTAPESANQSGLTSSKDTVLALAKTSLITGQNNTFKSPVTNSTGQQYATYFPGTGSSVIKLNNSINITTGEFTVEAWIFPTSVSNSPAILGNRYWSIGNNRGYVIGITSANKLYIAGSNGSWNSWPTILLSTGTVATNTWTHVALVRDSSNVMKFYINGVADTNAITYATSLDLAYSGGAPAGVVGGEIADGNIQSDIFNGYMSNLRVVVGTAVYTGSFTPPTTALTPIPNTKLLTCLGSTIIDYSPVPYNLTINGTVITADVSNLSATLTRAGTPTQGSVTPYWPDGQWSNYFNGTTDTLTAPSSSAFTFGTGDFTIECWFYVNALNSVANGIFVQGTSLFPASTSNTLAFGTLNTTNFQIYAANNQYVFSPAIVPVRNTWYHVALVRSSGTTTVYLNGVANRSIADTTNYTGTYFGVGDIYGGYNYRQNGYISNVRVVKGTALYTSNFTPSTTPLTAVSGTSLLTCQSNRFKDNSSNNFVITRTGTPSVQVFAPFEPSNNYSVTTHGGCAYFGQLASTDLLTLQASASAYDLSGSNWTVEAYINCEVTTFTDGQIRFLMGGSNGTASAWTFCINSDYSLSFSRPLTGSTVIQSAANAIVPNAWYHVAVSYFNGNAYMFVNGAVVAGPVAITKPSAASISFKIGYDSVGTVSTRFKGYISDVRINTTNAIYTTSFTPPTAPITSITGTTVLLNFKGAEIYDSTCLNTFNTINNATLSLTTVKNGPSIYFDGATDSLASTGNNTAMILGSGNFTIESWVNFSDAATNSLRVIWSNYNVAWTTDCIYFGKHTGISGRVGLYMYNQNSSGVAYVSDPQLPDTGWMHYAVVRSGNTITLYRNGYAVSSASTFTGSVNSSRTQSYIGTAESNYGYSLLGYIDGLRIIKSAIYTSNFIPPRDIESPSHLVSSTQSSTYNSGVTTTTENQLSFEKNSSPGLAGKFFNGDWRSIIATGNIGTFPLTTTNDSSNVTGTTGLPSAAHRYGVNLFPYITYSSVGDLYGFIAVGYFKPPTTGTYTFYTSSDDSSGIWIGATALNSFTEARAISNALVSNGLGVGQGDTKRSASISLVAGVWYPIRVVHEEGNGGDNLTFSWTGPGIAETTDLTTYFRTPSNGTILKGDYV